jgi:hypothetical protein
LCGVGFMFFKNVSAPYSSLLWDLCFRARIALSQAEAAECAYNEGQRQWALLFHRAAESSHHMILRAVADLTDEQADLLEPTITVLENQLRRLWPNWNDGMDFEAA